MIERAGKLLPFACEPVFDMAADIERYPEFLPWWIAANIRRREGNVVQVHQVVGLGPVRLAFESRAVLDRPRRIDVTSADRMYRRYTLSWRIAPQPAGCRVQVTADIELESWLLQRMLVGLLPAAVDGIVAAFDARALALAAVAARPAS
jgi:coenzyme Q-binding protein COQ10